VSQLRFVAAAGSAMPQTAASVDAVMAQRWLNNLMNGPFPEL
jgi:hypothetical protein